MEVPKLIHLKQLIFIIMVIILIKYVYFDSNKNNEYTKTDYLDPNHWFQRFKPGNNLPNQKIYPSKLSNLYKERIFTSKRPHKNHYKEKPSCRSMLEIHKSTEENWDKDDPYEELGKSLPPLLLWPKEEKYDGSQNNRATNYIERQDSLTTTNISENFENVNGSAPDPIMLDETRLQVLNGSVPYLPCKVAYYTPDDVETCVSARASAGASTWIAFVGASKMREKLHEFLNLLPGSLFYIYYVKEKQVSLEDFLDAISHKVHGDYDVIGYTNKIIKKDDSYKIKITVLWEPYGSGNKSDHRPSKHPSTRLFKWVTDEIIPDVIVIGLGTWYLVDIAHHDNENQLTPYDFLDYYIRKLLKPTLQQLSKKTKVLLWAHGRFRQYHLLSEPRPDGDFKKEKVNKWFESRVYIHTLTYSIGFMDSWLSNILLKDSQIWRWDSTLPFHYANIADCRSWRPSAITNLPDGMTEYVPQYIDNWWHCYDTHHSSYQTNHDEAIMLLNMLCNPYKSNMPDDLCC